MKIFRIFKVEKSDIEKQIQGLDDHIKNKTNEFGNVDRQVEEIKEILREKRDALVEVEKTLAEKSSLEKQISSKDSRKP